MIITKNINVKIKNKSQYEHFKNIGYKINYNDEIDVPISDLPIYSTYKIDVECDLCGLKANIPYQKYTKNQQKYDIYTCLKCSRTYKNKKTNLIRYGKEEPTFKEKCSNYQEKEKKKQEYKNEVKKQLLDNNYKNCISCGKDKELTEFTKNDRCVDGYYNVCTRCRNDNRNLYYKKNRDVMSKKHNIRRKKYRKNNIEKIRKSQRDYYHKVFKHTHKHSFIWRHILASALKRMNQKKTDSTIKLLKYSATDLKIHIEKLFTENMSWDNYGEWHIDHIKSVSLFNKSTHPSIVNALSNLKPMWATSREINGIFYEGNLNKGNNLE